ANSTFLKALKCGSNSKTEKKSKSRKLGCRCLGIDMGSSDFNRTRDGSVILRGYNKKAVTGKFHEFPILYNPKDLTRSCPLKVKINKLALIVPGKPDISLSGIGSAMPACIEPYDTLFRFPEQIVEIFKQKTGYNADLQSRRDPDLITPEPGLLYDT